MSESNGLLPIIMGIGLTVLSAGMVAGGRGEQSRWHAPLLNFAVLLIGLALLGAALYVLGSAIESGHRLTPADARLENHLSIALAVLLAVMAAYTAWKGFSSSADVDPWERGLLDRAAQFTGFITASFVVLLIGIAVVEAVISTVSIRGSGYSFLIGAVLLIGLGLSWVVLRVMTGGNPSPRAFMHSRRQQLKVLDALGDTPGTWVPIQLCAAAELEPPLRLSASMWTTVQGTYLRNEDANAVVRYHRWAANHAVVPTPALHRQRVTVFVGPRPDAMRGMRITPTTRRYLWRLDAIRAHRASAAPSADASAHERDAGLVYISHEQLREAGLQLRRDAASFP